MKDSSNISPTNVLNISNTNIGLRVKEIREIHGLSQTVLANQLSLNPSAISQIEGNRIKPSIETLLSISNNYNIDLHWLITGEHYDNSSELNDIDNNELCKLIEALNNAIKRISNISNTNYSSSLLDEIKSMIISTTNKWGSIGKTEELINDLLMTQKQLIKCQNELLEIYRKT